MKTETKAERAVRDFFATLLSPEMVLGCACAAIVVTYTWIACALIGGWI